MKNSKYQALFKFVKAKPKHQVPRLLAVTNGHPVYARLHIRVFDPKNKVKTLKDYFPNLKLKKEFDLISVITDGYTCLASGRSPGRYLVKEESIKKRKTSDICRLYWMK